MKMGLITWKRLWNAATRTSCQ